MAEIKRDDWPRIRATVLAYERTPLPPPRKPTRRPAPPPHSNLRVVLLDTMPARSRVDCAVTILEESNEIQELRLIATSTELSGHTFKLRFSSQTTADISLTATAAELQAALEALAAFAPGDLVVTKYPLLWLIEFTGQYAAVDVPLFEIVDPNFADSQFLLVAATDVWVENGDIVPVKEMLPVGEPSPLRGGAAGLVQWYHGVGYGLHAVEHLDFPDDDELDYEYA